MIRLITLTTFLGLLVLGCGSGDDCRVVDHEDGTTTIHCPGTPPVQIPPDPPLDEMGSLAGVVELFGATDHSGIEVRLEPADPALEAAAGGRIFRTLTGPNGDYRFDFIPQGFWSIVFEAEHRSPRRIDGIPIVPGLYHLDFVELRGGRLVADTGRALLSPEGDSALGVTTWDDVGFVDLWGLRDTEPRHLGYVIRSWGFDGSGTSVYTLDRWTFSGTLRHWPVEGGDVVVVADQVVEARFAGDRLVFQQVPTGETCRFKVWAPPGDAPPLDLGACIPEDPFSVSPDKEAIAWTRPDGIRVVQELASGVAWELGPDAGGTPWIFSTSGRFVVFLDVTRALSVLDRETGDIRILTTAETRNIRFSPADDALIVVTLPLGGEPEHWLHDLRVGEAQLLFTGPTAGDWAFSGNGRRLATSVPGLADRSQVVAIDRIRPERRQWLDLPSVVGLTWAPDGMDLLIDTTEGLVLWEMDTEADPLVMAEREGVARVWSADGELVAVGGWEKVTIFDRRLRTLTELAFAGAEITGLHWLPSDNGLLIQRESPYGADVRHWILGSGRAPTSVLDGTFVHVVPDPDGQGFLYIRCGSTCSEKVLGHFDLPSLRSTPLDDEVERITARRLGYLYEIEKGDRAGWYFAPRP